MMMVIYTKANVFGGTGGRAVWTPLQVHVQPLTHGTLCAGDSGDSDGQ